MKLLLPQQRYLEGCLPSRTKHILTGTLSGHDVRALLPQNHTLIFKIEVALWSREAEFKLNREHIY